MIRLLQLLWWYLMIGLAPVCVVGLLALTVNPQKFDLSMRASLILASLATTVFWTYTLSK
jgi:hypothetical protein